MKTTLREQRLQQLLDNCQQEVLRQIIGPFGLTPAMFDDKDGGNVTTQHNAEQGIFAKESEQFKRTDYDYAAAKRAKMRQAVQDGSMNSQEFVDAYTGQHQPTKRENGAGKLVMNAELDHLVPLCDIHAQGGWMEDQEGRKELSSDPNNLHFTTHDTNRGKGGKAPGEALSEQNGYDPDTIEPMVEQAQASLDEKLPGTTDRLKYHGKELLGTGVKEAGRNALRQAMGVVLHEFAQGSFVEIKVLLRERASQRSLVDRLVESLRKVMRRVLSKLKAVLEALVQGGVQGFVSNLLTFLINNLITTSKQIVTLIRESMRSLWKAIKLMLNPPPGMPALEVAREVSKIIAVAVTTGLGMLMEQSIKGFILSVPLLAPIGEVLATGVTAIMTGIAGALVVYGIDRLFDWLSSTGTELLEALETNLDAQAVVATRLQEQLQLQFDSSRLYAMVSADFRRTQDTYASAAFQLDTARLSASASIASRAATIDTVSSQLERRKALAAALDDL